MSSAFSAYAVLVQQSLDAAQTDTELFSYPSGRRARPVEIDHDLKILQGETITQPPRTDHTRGSDVRPRAVVFAAIRQDRSYLAELFEQVRTVPITS
jgi:hypothetical protein